MPCYASNLPAENQLPRTTIIHLTDLPATNDTLLKHTVSEYFRSNEFSDERLIVHSNLSDSIIFVSCPLLSSARLAYAQHRPLVLSPDVIWLVIERGFVKHVDMHAEELRSKIVTFKGKKTLKIYSRGLMNKSAEAWEPLFSQFAGQMAPWTGMELIQTLTADFSTTTPVALVASEIMMMSALQHYFEYDVIAFCGIPDIYLEGTTEDWNHLIEKTNALRQYELDWWIDELVPVLQKIAAATEGERDIAFWQSIIRKHDIPVEGEEICDYTPPREKIDGWIVKFYPYSKYKRNNLDFLYDTDIPDLPNEEGSAPLKYTDTNGTIYNLDIHAGLIGIEEDVATRALRPIITWWITQPLTKKERYN